MNWFLGSLFLIFLVSNQSLAIEVSFRSLRSLVETRNESVQSYKKQIEAAQLQTGNLTRSFLPNLSLNAGAEAFNVGTRISKQQPYYGIQSSINLYNGGNDQLKEELASLRVTKDQTKVKIVLAKELATARELYWRIAYHEQELKLIEFMLNKNNKNLQSAEKRITSGVASPIDRLEFEMKNLDLIRGKMQTIAKRTAHKFDLLVRIGADLHEPLIIQDSLEHLGEWEKELNHTHHKHDFFTKIYKIHTDELRLQSQKFNRQNRPEIDLYANWQQYNQFNKDNPIQRERQQSAIGIRLKFDLFDRQVSSKKAQTLMAKASAADSMRIYQERINEAHIEKEFLELKSLHDQVHDAEKHITMAEKYYKRTQAEYARGAKNSPDVLGASEKLEQATRIKYQLLRDFHIARSHAMSKIGR